jgi:5-methylcytosine-specific restriction protein A
MSAYLLKWNPRLWPWNSISTDAAKTEKGQFVRASWTCGRTKKIRKGDRVFIIRLGDKPKGLIASGWATSNWYPGKFRGRSVVRVDCKLDRILDWEVDALLPLSRLKQGKLNKVAWTNQGAGVEIYGDILDEIEQLWAMQIGRNSTSVPIDERPAIEGEERRRLVRHYMRETWKREEKIFEAQKKHNGRLICEIAGCGFDFFEVYGKLGKGYAQIHHRKPLNSRTSPSKTLLKDLLVVCANCHAMIHRYGACRSPRGLIR